MSDKTLKDIITESHFKAVEEKAKPEVEFNRIVYVPYSDGSNHYLLKMEFTVDVQDNKVITENTLAVITGVANLHQKVISLRHPIDQDNLRYYYEKSSKVKMEEKQC
jgi:hypothetical protein